MKDTSYSLGEVFLFTMIWMGIIFGGISVLALFTDMLHGIFTYIGILPEETHCGLQ